MWSPNDFDQVDNECDRLSAAARWIEDRHLAFPLPCAARKGLAIVCFDQALEHQKAIYALTKNRLYGSAHALISPFYEALTRGAWLLRCASDAQAEAFQAGNRRTLTHLTNSAKISEDLENTITGYPMFREMRTLYWSTFSDVTHTVGMQAMTRLGYETEGRGYLPDEVIYTLRIAALLGFTALEEIAEATGDSAMQIEASAYAKGYWAAVPRTPASYNRSKVWPQAAGVTSD